MKKTLINPKIFVKPGRIRSESGPGEKKRWTKIELDALYLIDIFLDWISSIFN